MSWGPLSCPGVCFGREGGEWCHPRVIWERMVHPRVTRERMELVGTLRLDGRVSDLDGARKVASSAITPIPLHHARSLAVHVYVGCRCRTHAGSRPAQARIVPRGRAELMRRVVRRGHTHTGRARVQSRTRGPTRGFAHITIGPSPLGAYVHSVLCSVDCTRARGPKARQAGAAADRQ